MSDNPLLPSVDPLGFGIGPETGNALLGAGKAWLDWRNANATATLEGLGKPLMEDGQLNLEHPILGLVGPGAIKGFHGTPHRFQPVEGNPFGEFRNEAIGSGEGAQAYGWGHYIAGNPKVAEGYKEALSGDIPSGPTYRGQTIDDYIRMGATAQELEDIWPLNVRSALSEARGNSELAKSIIDKYEYSEGQRSWLKNWIDNNKETLGYREKPGNLLEVHILPDEHELLDWDKPLGQQAPAIREVLKKWLPAEGEIRPRDPNLPAWTGADLYGWLSGGMTKASRRAATGYMPPQEGSQELASKALHEAGIPGIRYLDAGSRQAGEGTYNYVIFDPSNLRIIGRNGERLQPVDHDPFTGTKP